MNKHKSFYIFIIYVILSIILTYPLFFLNNGLIGPKEDNLHSYWNAWHFKKAIFDKNEKIFFTKDLYYPKGASLLLHTLSPFNLGLEFILNLILPLSYSYNLIIFLSFPLAAYFTFLLCFYLTKNKLASFVGGLIFAFSPYHFARALHHMNLVAIYFFPLLALFFFKLKDKPSIKYSLIVSLILVFIAFTDHYYLIFSLAFLFLGLLYFSFSSKKRVKFFKYVIYSLIITSIVISPFIISTLLELKNNTYPKAGGYNIYVLDTFSFITPSPWHTVFGKFTKDIYNRFTGNWWESAGYLGFTTLFLFVFGWVKNKERKKEKYFFLLLFFIAIILSLGTCLHILGHEKIAIPLPYYFLKKIPILNMARSPSRWIALSYLSLAVLASFGLKKLLQKFKKRQKYIVYPIVLGLIIFEYLAIPLKYTKIEVPSFYYTIAVEDSDYAIFDIPCKNWVGNAEFMFFQTIHNKKLLFATLARKSKEMETFLISTKLSEFCKLNNLTSLNKEILKSNNIKYVVLHKDYLDQNEILTLINKLKNSFVYVYEDKKIIVYKIY